MIAMIALVKSPYQKVQASLKDPTKKIEIGFKAIYRHIAQINEREAKDVGVAV